VEQKWTVQGVVRALLPEINVLVVTHEEISGYMPAMTMGFRARDPKLYDGIEVGDSIRFTLRGVPPNVLITEIGKQGKP
jgi:Cu/Ag efflux protein CusF